MLPGSLVPARFAGGAAVVANKFLMASDAGFARDVPRVCNLA